MIKEYEEIEEIRKASAITRSAFSRVLTTVSPGIMEYQVEAEIIGEFIRQGAEGHAYEPIVASGKNALILHYVQNNGVCRDGELLLLDFGAEVNNYAADCSRTIPVNGRFTKRQLEVYKAAMRVFKQARELMIPGTLMAEFHSSVGAIWEEEHIGLGLYSLKQAKESPEGEPLWKQFFMHGTSHSLGIDVHDPFDRTQPFQAGMVLTCEPAIYLPGEGIGIRLENDILITEQAPVDLLHDIPIEAEEIEELMR
jgi:Xaa-Pro aminopeptidase